MEGIIRHKKPNIMCDSLFLKVTSERAKLMIIHSNSIIFDFFFLQQNIKKEIQKVPISVYFGAQIFIDITIRLI